MVPAGLTDRPVTWVALAGFMGTGKTRIGWELSRALALHYIDTDKLISRVCGKSIPDLFADEGEDFFRACERETVERVCRLDHAVVSLGGGTFLSESNRDALLQRGPVVVLWASAETVYQRTRHSDRPLLQVPNPLERIEAMLRERQAAYSEGTIHVQSDGRPSEEIVEEVVARLWDWAAGEDWSAEEMRAAQRERALSRHFPVRLAAAQDIRIQVSRRASGGPTCAVQMTESCLALRHVLTSDLDLEAVSGTPTALGHTGPQS